MARKKSEDRHLGRRIEFYMPEREFADMIAGMAATHETNKSMFIRSAVKSFCDYLKQSFCDCLTPKKENAK